MKRSVGNTKINGFAPAIAGSAAIVASEAAAQDDYGAGLLGGSLDESLYGYGVADFYGSEVLGAGGEEIGEVQNVVRSCNTYAVVNIDSKWFDVGSRKVIIPIGQLTVTDGGHDGGEHHAQQHLAVSGLPRRHGPDGRPTRRTVRPDR